MITGFKVLVWQIFLIVFAVFLVYFAIKFFNQLLKKQKQ